MDGPRVTIIPYRPRKLQAVIHSKLKRFNVFVCHRRFGKTVLCINEAIKRALAESPHKERRYAYIAPLYKQAKAVAWDYLKQFTAPIEGRIVNESELRVDLPNGSRIRLFGADNPDALRGVYLDGVILDEYADMHPRLWEEVVRPLLADRKGWAIFIGTPRGRNQFWELFEKAQADPEWYTAIFRASETGIIDASEVAAMKRDMDPDAYEQELECSFIAAIKGAFYGVILNELEKAGRIRSVPYDPGLKTFTSWDLGWTDDTAIWVYQVAPFEIRYIDYHCTSGQKIEHYTKWLQDKPYHYTKHWLPPDARASTLPANGVTTIQQVAAQLGGVEKVGICPDLDLQDHINATRAILPRCWFDADRCKQGLEALRQYQRTWDAERKVFMPKPLHNWASHGATAFHTGIAAYQDANPSAVPVSAFRTPTLNEAWGRQGYADEGRI